MSRDNLETMLFFLERIIYTIDTGSKPSMTAPDWCKFIGRKVKSLRLKVRNTGKRVYYTLEFDLSIPPLWGIYVHIDALIPTWIILVMQIVNELMHSSVRNGDMFTYSSAELTQFAVSGNIVAEQAGWVCECQAYRSQVSPLTYPTITFFNQNLTDEIDDGW